MILFYRRMLRVILVQACGLVCGVWQCQTAGMGFGALGTHGFFVDIIRHGCLKTMALMSIFTEQSKPEFILTAHGIAWTVYHQDICTYIDIYRGMSPNRCMAATIVRNDMGWILGRDDLCNLLFHVC